MKTNRMITIDHEMNLKLKEEPNASALLNSLLNAHYGAGKLTKEMVEMKIVQIEKNIRDEQEELAKAKAQLKDASKPLTMQEKISRGLIKL